VERVHAYATTIEKEGELVTKFDKDNSLGETWPQRGDIRLKDITMAYRSDTPTVLNGISLDIKGGERVGVVGRTGCGKSSLLSTILRLVNLKSGSIEIDGVDISKVGLHTLREKTAIIPQDPSILTGTVRFNLDPFGMKSDAELWGALEKSQLKARIEKAEGQLDSKVDEGGGNFSIGELQLMCLARALLRKLPAGGLLLLDEATSSLDAATDEVIQRVIRAEFTCTTITIAHRIQTLLDYDRIVVLDAGKVKEFDSPKALLQRPGSEFASLAKEAGITS